MMDAHRSTSDRSLRELHRPGTPLIIPNVWDAASARQFERRGFRVLATSSGAVAAAAGYLDHEGAPVEVMLAANDRIVAAVAVPVSVDLEAGYGLEPETIVEHAASAGYAGINVEDSEHHRNELRAADAQSARIAGLARNRDAALPGLVLNARIDVFLKRGPFEEAVRRGRMYADAGADCIFPIGLSRDSDIARFVEESGAPVNILARSGVSSPERLAELGVARITFGSIPYRLAVAEAEAAVRRYLAGDSSHLDPTLGSPIVGA
jgi:2-methylisocitrate lyase-like PEP mutase family enzyme